MRRLIASAIELQRYEPASDRAKWAAAYEKYLKIIQ